MVVSLEAKVLVVMSQQAPRHPYPTIPETHISHHPDDSKQVHFT